MLQRDAVRAGWDGEFGVVSGGDNPLDDARVMSALDLVISVDTMTAHLAGALGRNTWTLLPFDADWRWMKDREDCPWYPTMRLFRQQRQGDWSGLVAEVAIELQRKLNLQEPNRTELTRTSQLSRGLQKQSR
jgi:ADP-heptose:LPS heptosyltransferase